MPLVADYVVFCLWLWCIGPVCDSDQVIPQVNNRLQENSQGTPLEATTNVNVEVYSAHVFGFVRLTLLRLQ